LKLTTVNTSSEQLDLIEIYFLFIDNDVPLPNMTIIFGTIDKEKKLDIYSLTCLLKSFRIEKTVPQFYN